jgi:hypothetical protein
MTTRQKKQNKKPSALKHGAFCRMAFLPGEDPGEFHELFRRLCEEWTPSGPTEYDSVSTIAKGLWRKNRVQGYVAGSISRYQVDPKSKGYDAAYALAAVLSLLETEPELVANALRACPQWIQEHIKTNYPPESYTRSGWNAAVRDELTAIVRSALERAKAREENPGHRDIRLAAMLEEGVFTTEIKAEERLDAMIDRAVKRLVQAKAMKPLLASPSLNGQAQQPKTISNSKRGEAQSPNQEH